MASLISSLSLPSPSLHFPFPLPPKLPAYLVLATLLLLLLLLTRLSKPGSQPPKSTPKPLPLPPSPPGALPLIGHAHLIPPSHSWLLFKSWTDRLGPVVHLSILGRSHVLLGSESVANTLLRERGSIYSDREQLPAAAVLLSDGRNSLMAPYGELFRRTRRFLNHGVGRNAAEGAKRHERGQWAEGVKLLAGLRETMAPGGERDYEGAFERYAVGVAKRAIYGGRLEDGEGGRREKEVILDVAHVLEKVASPGAYAVDLIPALRHLPEWLPGMAWKRYLKGVQRRDERFFEECLAPVKQQIKREERAAREGTLGKEVKVVDSLAKEWLTDMEKWGMSYGEGLYVLGGMYEAASGTTPAAMTSFVLAMTRWPEHFRNLQEEIDGVVGGERMPGFGDVEALPLVRATIKEVLRYYPVTAGGVPHKSTREDEIMGFRIPEGSLVHANQWAIHRDPELYPDPEAFDPGRWLRRDSPVYKEPLSKFPNVNGWSCFGFGRRICPGLNLAERSLYLLVMLVGWGCRITRAKSGDGGEEVVPPEYDFVDGFNVGPKRFEFELRGRSEERDEMVRREWERIVREDPLLAG
ncbi:O-methylsterigmatocystin oxidoreductase 3 [Zalerion maritima]|uniref:O-methylsterigmatocystin oxidoreductase 3 n=1 Tax=Zalerion maritima TaxID=339359 RepID=A0AAD5WV69_9PEZI|nr:O-methylsterigmatocystin oxidoreductase 3 [Zalerion maritima]